MRKIPTLDEFRGEIDRIDDALHDLLIRRTELSQEIAKVKGLQGLSTGFAAMRPAREAAILRRLVARHRGDLPAAVLVRLWREIISASLRIQAEFQLHIAAGEDALPFLALAHGHFGTLTPVKSHKRPQLVVQACAEEPNSIGLVPLPSSEEPGPSWWAQLAPAGEKGPRIIAKLPFIVEGEGALAGYAIGAIEQEPTGDDTTLLLLEIAPGLSRGRLQGLMKEAGFEVRLAAAGRVLEKGVPDEILAEVKGFVASGDERLAKLAVAADDAILSAKPIGGYANPMVLA